MAKRPLNVLGYELVTQKMVNGDWQARIFDFEILEYYFTKIIENVPLSERKFHTKTKMINLLWFNQSSQDADIWEGQFITARHGKERTIFNILKQVDEGVIDKNRGAKNTIYFTVHRKTGLMLVERDSERVASKEMIYKFIRFHKDLIVPYQKAFNKKFKDASIHKGNFLKVVTLPKKGFFEDLKEFKTVKEAYFYLDISETENVNNEASNLLYLESEASATVEDSYKEHEDLIDLIKQSKDGGLRGTTKIKVSFESNVSSIGIRGVKDYFSKLIESDLYDGFGVTGNLESGRSRTIELETVQRSFDISVDFNDKGLPSLQDMYDGMSKIFKTDNPLSFKEQFDQFEGVEIHENSKGEEV